MAPWQEANAIACATRLLTSYYRYRGEALIPVTGNALEDARRLFEAPYPVIAHGAEDDPVLCYGNRATLRLWSMDWAMLVSTPSRFTAEPAVRAEREALLKHVAEYGFIDAYSGVRIAADGQRFRIRNAFVWNLTDERGDTHGQAAAFTDYEFLETSGEKCLCSK